MEEGLGGMLNGAAIRPPRLEEAGLEDCALPPESIMEAFSRAAISMKSRFAGDDDEDGADGCVQDPGPSNGEVPDALVGGQVREATSPPVRGAGAGGESKERGKGGQDEVVIVGAGGGDLASDKVLVLGGEETEEAEGKRSCVGSGDEVFVRGEKKKGHEELEEEEEEGDSERSILVEDLI